MKINSLEDCQRAEAVCWKAISTIHARLRWLKWHAVIDSFDCSTKLSEVKKAAHYLAVAEAKVSEELKEFRRLKHEAECRHG
jgi:hypothetical protein